MVFSLSPHISTQSDKTLSGPPRIDGYTNGTLAKAPYNQVNHISDPIAAHLHHLPRCDGNG